MRTLTCITAAIAVAVGGWSCTKEDETTIINTTSTQAPAKDPAHHQDKSCDSCHTNWNLVQMHDASSTEYNSDCISCHGDMTDEATLSSSVAGIHPYHDSHVYLAAGQTETNNAVCLYCHKDVDLLGGSAGHLRKQVNITNECRGCHTTAGPGPAFYR